MNQFEFLSQLYCDRPLVTQLKVLIHPQIYADYTDVEHSFLATPIVETIHIQARRRVFDARLFVFSFYV